MVTEVRTRHDVASESWLERWPSGGFLFSPASGYPTPAAYVADGTGAVLHAWSHAAHQPKPEDQPPNFLRGWNHVELDAEGNLFAIVPLRALLKLTPASELAWSCDVAAHHDVSLGDGGAIFVLTEAPRLVKAGGCSCVVLDNLVALLDPDGVVKAEVSLHDLLRTDPGLRRLIDDTVRRRNEEFRCRGWPAPGDDVPPAVVQETRAILSSATYHGERRQALRRLRELPGSPCDVLHTNTLELLDAHPRGMWERGDLLVCMRELNTIAVINLIRAEVRWRWGAGELSGPHQPSVLPDGRVLVFDNGVSRRRTRLVAVDPCTREVVWTWAAQPPASFFCPLAGGCEALPNGNLLVTNSSAGAAFELTRHGRTVWELTLPIDVYGAERGRVSIYRMSAVAPEVVTRVMQRRRPESPAALAHIPHRGLAGRATSGHTGVPACES